MTPAEALAAFGSSYHWKLLAEQARLQREMLYAEHLMQTRYRAAATGDGPIIEGDFTVVDADAPRLTASDVDPS